MRLVNLFSLLFLISINAAIAADWSDSAYVERIYIHSTQNENGTVYYKFSDMINPEGCDNAGYIAVLKTNSLFSEIYSLTLTAQATNQQVIYYAKGCVDSGHPELLHIRMD